MARWRRIILQVNFISVNKRKANSLTYITVAKYSHLDEHVWAWQGRLITGTSIAGSVPPLYSSYQDSTLFTLLSVQLSSVSSRGYLDAPAIAPPPPCRPLQPEEMWDASRHLRLETKPKCELSQDDFQILAFWSTWVIKQTVKRSCFLIMGHMSFRRVYSFFLKVSPSD